MASVDVRRIDGSVSGSVELNESFFGIQPNVPVMHQVVTAQLAAARAGTQSTLTRAEVRGGGRKPLRQKGTGRARQGSIRAPHWSGGGVALGPKPRSYKQKTPKKMVQLALRSALSDRAMDGKVVVVDDWGITEPKTKPAKAALASLNLEGKVLVVLSRGDENVYRSFLNLAEVQLLLDEELNPYDILCNDWIVFTSANLPGGATLSQAPAASAPATPATPAAPAATPAETEETAETTNE
jgi:large subunit ribosomal protein L4